MEPTREKGELQLSREALRERFSRHAAERLKATATTQYAAVAAIVRYRQGPELLFIQRSQRPGDRWGGQMAFPGGRQEPEDADTLATAVRETQEEVGLSLGQDAALLGRLDDVQAIAHGRKQNLVIVPYVFVLDAPAPLSLAQSEVAEAHWAPLSPMARGEVDTIQPYLFEGRQLEFPGYAVAGQVVWGLTFRMLQLFFDVARARSSGT